MPALTRMVVGRGGEVGGSICFPNRVNRISLELDVGCDY